MKHLNNFRLLSAQLNKLIDDINKLKYKIVKSFEKSKFNIINKEFKDFNIQKIRDYYNCKEITLEMFYNWFKDEYCKYFTIIYDKKSDKIICEKYNIGDENKNGR